MHENPRPLRRLNLGTFPELNAKKSRYSTKRSMQMCIREKHNKLITSVIIMHKLCWYSSDHSIFAVCAVCHINTCSVLGTFLQMHHCDPPILSSSFSHMPSLYPSFLCTSVLLIHSLPFLVFLDSHFSLSLSSLLFGLGGCVKGSFHTL